MLKVVALGLVKSLKDHSAASCITYIHGVPCGIKYSHQVTVNLEYLFNIIPLVRRPGQVAKVAHVHRAPGGSRAQADEGHGWRRGPRRVIQWQ